MTNVLSQQHCPSLFRLFTRQGCLIARLTKPELQTKTTDEYYLILTWSHLHQNLTNGLGTALRSCWAAQDENLGTGIAKWNCFTCLMEIRSQFMPTLLTSRSCNAHNPLLLNVRAPSLYRHIGAHCSAGSYSYMSEWERWGLYQGLYSLVS